MKRILFVDDEPNVLSGLRRMMRPLRHEWEMHFVDGAEAALAAMREQAFEVLVTDMRMPGMAGLELLEQVRDLYPQTVRLALSGHSEMEMLLRCTRVAHQFLAKPCAADVLKTAVERSGALRALLADESVQRLVAGTDALPSLPELYEELNSALADEDVTIASVGAIVERDVAMSAKILQVVNSAFFGLRRHVSTPAEAAGLLGLDIIRGMVLTAGAFSAFDARARGFDQARLWDHSMVVGALARVLAREAGLDRHGQDFAFQGALLHDVGRLILAAKQPDRFGEVVDLAGAEGITLTEAEQRTFGHAHAVVGAYLLGLWGLPDPIVEAVAYHHAPGECASSEIGALAVVHAANVLAQEIDGPGRTAATLDEAFLQRCGAAVHLDRWRALAAEQLGAAEAA